MKPGDIVEATLSPQRTDDLKPEAAAVVGQRFRWTCVREVEDNGPAYDGQWRLELGCKDYQKAGVWWVAECDLSDIVHVGVNQRVADEYDLTHPAT